MEGIYALQTARAGSKGVPDKNITEIRGKPLYRHNIDLANQSIFIEKVFTSTDCPYIMREADDTYEVINRPPELATDDCSHWDTIRHGLHEIEERMGVEAEILVILFGNTLGARPQDLDSAIQQMLEDESIDSFQSVSEFNMFTPIRAMQEDEEGNLTTIMSQPAIREVTNGEEANDRGSAGNALFFNGSFWICRRRAILAQCVGGGLLPFPWLGNKIKPLRQPTIMEIDAPWQLKWLENGLGFSNWPFMD